MALQGVMKKMPMSPGASPFSATSRRRRSFAASSRAVSMGSRLSIMSG